MLSAVIIIKPMVRAMRTPSGPETWQVSGREDATCGTEDEADLWDRASSHLLVSPTSLACERNSVSVISSICVRTNPVSDCCHLARVK